MIIWLNGAFGAGKTTLAQELYRRLPDAVIYDPEDVGAMLWKWMAPNEDFQDLPSWRELVVATAVSLRRHHADVLVVPMSLLRDGYRDEIFNGLSEAGEPVLHVFLDVGDQALGERLSARTARGHDAGWDETGYAWAVSRNEAAVGAATRQPTGTLVLRSDELSPAELADAVLAEASANLVEATLWIQTVAAEGAQPGLSSCSTRRP